MKVALLCGVAALAFSTSGSAQSTAPANPSPVSNGAASPQAVITTPPPASGELQEIVVTAQKRSENLQRTPIAVSAITADVIREKGLSNASELTAVAPSLTVSPGASSTTNITVFIRGIGDSEQALTTDSPIGLYVDGIVIGRSAGAAFDILDLERVEVLRGPQGTLYGRNTIGGAVNLITSKPSETFGVSGGGSVGNFDLRQSKVSLDTGLIGETGLSARVTYLHKERSGYVDDANQPDRRDPGAINLDALRATLRLRQGPLTLDYGFDYSVRQSYSPALQLTVVEPGIAAYLNASPLLGGAAIQVSPRRLSNAGRSPNGRITDRVQGHTLTGEVNLDFATLRSLTGYRSWHGVNRPDAVISNSGLVGFTVGPEILAPPFTFNPRGVTPVNLFIAQNDRKQHQWSQEFDLIGNIGDRFDYVVGAYYFKERARETNPTSFLFVIPSPVPIPLTPQVTLDGFGVQIPALLDYVSRSKSQAVFAQGTYKLFDGVRLTGGIRYTKDNKRLTQTAPSVRDARLSFSKVNYAISLDYQISPDILSYARVSSGYKSGGFNARSGNNGFRPETLTSYETGLKSELLDRRLRLNLTSFYATHDDVQLAQTQAGTAGAVTNTVNAGKARYWGLEGEIVFIPTQGLTLTSNAGYVNRKYRQFLIRDSATDLLVDVKNSARFVNAATTTVNASARYEFPRTSLGIVAARVDYDYRGKVYFNPTTVGAPNNNVIAANPRGLFNTRLSLGDIGIGGGAAEVALWGKNVFNKHYRAFGIDFGALGYAGNIYGEPATYGMDVNFRF